jgi:hypothetical protein
MKHKRIRIIITNHQIIYILILLHQYLWLGRRWKCESDARVITIQCEQYGVTVHLFIGMGCSPDKITFMSLTFTVNHKASYQGLSSLFPFRSVSSSSFVIILSRSSFSHRLGASSSCLRVVYPCWGEGKDATLRSKPSLQPLLWQRQNRQEHTSLDRHQTKTGDEVIPQCGLVQLRGPRAIRPIVTGPAWPPRVTGLICKDIPVITVCNPALWEYSGIT